MLLVQQTTWSFQRLNTSNKQNFERRGKTHGFVGAEAHSQFEHTARAWRRIVHRSKQSRIEEDFYAERFICRISESLFKRASPTCG